MRPASTLSTSDPTIRRRAAGRDAGEFEIEAALDPARGLADAAIAAAVTEPTLFDDDEDRRGRGAAVETTFAEDFVEEEDSGRRARRRAADARPPMTIACWNNPCTLRRSRCSAAAEPEPDPPVSRRAGTARGPAVLPFAVTASCSCLLVGFAAGYFVGQPRSPAPCRGRRRVRAPPAAATPQPAAAPAGAATPETAGAVQRAEGHGAAARRAPAPARRPRPRRRRPPPPAPPPTTARGRPRRRPARIAGHLVVRSTPSRAAVTRQRAVARPHAADARRAAVRELRRARRAGRLRRRARGSHADARRTRRARSTRASRRSQRQASLGRRSRPAPRPAAPTPDAARRADHGFAVRRLASARRDRRCVDGKHRRPDAAHPAGSARSAHTSCGSKWPARNPGRRSPRVTAGQDRTRAPARSRIRR